MPTILFHELIADKFAKKNKKYDTNNFYLGAMVPDAVNCYGFASKEDRWNAHIRDENLNIWQENILNFYNQNKGQFEDTYLTGYVVHVLTDIICDKIYTEKLYPELLKKGYDYHTAYAYYEQGIRKFEHNNINEKWWNEAKQKIKLGDKIPINNINEKMIEDWIQRVEEQYNSVVYEEEEYITMDFANEVFEEVGNIVKRNIIEYKKMLHKI